MMVTAMIYKLLILLLLLPVVHLREDNCDQLAYIDCTDDSEDSD